MATLPPSPTASASVQVVVRLRPLNDKEKKHGTLPVVSASTNDKSVTVIKGQGARQIRSNYRFDNVFTAFSSQEEVFEETLKPVIRDVLRGFESTVFAYGQTGTGKTHTMEGDLSNPEMHGVIPRSAAAIFKDLNSSEYSSTSVSCSFLEIYNEDLCDLLADPVVGYGKRPKLDIMVGKNGPFCRGLSETKVDSADHVFALMRKAQQQRQVGETNMNKQSSRSHCIFTLRIEAKKKLRDGSILEIAGKLHCVDLAGSECAKSADLEKGNDGQAARERERLNINRSLLTLGRVVSMLKERQDSNKKKSRIPYRDSKLTRILQESLGGRCKTCLIATISPSVTAIEESMSTLNYAQAANGIVNKPVTTSYMTQGASSFSSSDAQNASNKGDNAAYSVEHWQEMECRLQYMQTQVEEAQNALARKHLQQQELVEKAEQAEASRKEAVEKCEEAEKKIFSLEEKIQIQVEEYEALGQQLSKTETTLKKTVAILEATQNTEICLTNEAKSLLAALKQSIQQGDSIYKSLQRSRDESIQQREASRRFKVTLLSVFADILGSLSHLKALQNENRDFLSETTSSNSKTDRAFLDHTRSIVEGTAEHVAEVVSVLNRQLLDEGGLVPSVAAMGDSAREHLSLIDERITASAADIRTSSKSIRAALSEATTNMKAMEDNYLNSSSHLLKAVETSILESKENLSTLISDASKSFLKHSEATSNSRQKILGISSDWKTSNLTSAQHVQAVVAQESRSVEEMFGILTQQVQKQEEVRNHLLQHGQYIETSKSTHLEGLENQGALLKAQQEEIQSSLERSKVFCEQFVNNVMGDVQKLLHHQMEKMTLQNEEMYDRMMSKTQSVADSNIDIRQSANRILEDVASSNKMLQDHSEYVHLNDSNAVKALDTTKRSLEVVNTTCDKIALDANNYEMAVSNESDEAEDLAQKRIDEVKSSLAKGETSLNNQIDSQILDRTRGGIAELVHSTKEVSSFVEDKLIEKTKLALTDKIETPATASLKTIQEDAAAIASVIDEGQEAIEAKASEQKATVLSLEKDINSSTAEMKVRIEKQSEDVTSREQALLQALEAHGQSIAETLSHSSQELSTGRESFTDFVQTVVKAEEPVPEIENRTIPTFSQHLSSTPSETEILKNVSLHALNGYSDKENSPTRHNGPPRVKGQRSMSGESVLSVVRTNSFGSATTSSAERPKRRGDSRRKESLSKRSKTLRLSIPKAETM